VAGDVATARTAETDVTQADAEQQDQTGQQLPAADGGVAADAAAPGAPGQPPSPDAAPLDAASPDTAPPGGEPAVPSASEPPAAPAADGRPASPTPATGGRAKPPAPGSTESAGRARNSARPSRGRGGVLPARATPASDTGAAAAGTAAVRRRLARLGAPRGGGANPVLEPLIKTVRATHPKANVRLIERAYDIAARQHAGQVRKSGDPFITHPLAVATILAELGMPAETLCAALLHDTIEDTDYTLDELRREFGDDVATLVDGVTKLDKVKYGEAAQAETVRKMVVAMSRDIRVLVVKLADRLHNMRTLRYLPREKQEQKSREVLEIFAPLAHRLGMNTVKWELEDLAFSMLFPKRYDEIVRLVSERAPRRDVFLEQVKEQIDGDLHDAKIKARVTGRPKHYYSVYQKMIARNVGFDDIYDLVGIRVLVDSVRDCYAALGTVHARWNPVPGRFKDYIAMPKFNMYQSLHTTVIGPEGKPVELQIRTWDMHRRAEYGVAAHWKYKEETMAGGGHGTADLPWLRQLVDWQRETTDPAEFLESLRFDLGAAEVYVFTPRGEVIALPQGASPVDFAYAIHTEVGHRCIGARVNGRLVALESELNNGDTVEIFTSKAQDAAPSRDWLQFVKSARARNKIRHWFSKERREAAAETGKAAIARTMRKQGLPLQRLATGDALLAMAHDLRYADLSALYAAIGEGHVSAQSVVAKLVKSAGGIAGAQEDLAETTLLTRAPKPQPAGDSGVVVEGSADVWARLSKCCTPVPGDPITGFVTRGNGVSVHRSDCVNLRHLVESQPERVVKVHWSPREGSLFLVAIQTEALDRTGLLSDVTRAISDQHVNILSASVTTTRDRVAVSRFTVEMGDPKHLGHVLRAVRSVDGVYDVYRITN
jgi:GTP diphosphokinase / guanosine-3',5'-bis(diphosphate) 3'-diphosphatase